MTDGHRLDSLEQQARRELLRLAKAASLGMGLAVLTGCAGKSPKSAVATDRRAESRWLAASGNAGQGPFSLGVASGSPRAQSVVIWTRLHMGSHESVASDANKSSKSVFPPGPIAVTWEVAEDEHFARLVAFGKADAVQELGRSVHVEVKGLQAARWYFYRFRVGDAVSPVGRTRTTPDVNAARMPDRMRMVLASCQNWQHGFFHAWRHAAQDAPDLVVFVGDYIYEYGSSRAELGTGENDIVRYHGSNEVMTLDEYRQRYALYKSDADLQAAHRVAPWLVTWDDHEVANDYAADQDERLRPNFLARRAAAYQAFWENMPLPLSVLEKSMSPNMRIYERYPWGRLASIHMLDDRQYRDIQVCPDPGKGGGAATPWLHQCPALNDAKRSLLGREQERWLAEGLKSDRSVWSVVGQQTLMAETNQASSAEQASGQARYWTDGWNGYRPARERFYADLKLAQDHGAARDTLVLSGDVHSWYVADLHAQSSKKVLASEFCGSSITSNSGWTQERAERVAKANAQYRYARVDRRGYTLLDLTSKSTTVQLRAVGSVKTTASRIETLKTFTVEQGKPGVA